MENNTSPVKLKDQPQKRDFVGEWQNQIKAKLGNDSTKEIVVQTQKQTVICNKITPKDVSKIPSVVAMRRTDAQGIKNFFVYLILNSCGGGCNTFFFEFGYRECRRNSKYHSWRGS